MKASQAVELLKELGDKHIAVQWFSKEDYEQNTGMRISSDVWELSTIMFDHEPVTMDVFELELCIEQAAEAIELGDDM
jgi:hypothetical protein